MTSEPFAGRYSELQFVGRGGFGAVYRAYDLKLKCIRALKLLNPELAADEDYRERFRREATSAAGLSHPNITVVFDEGIFGDQPYIVMEYVEGESLSRVIETRPTLDDAARLDLIEQLCDGLHYAHRRGIIHRDIKPVNLLIREDQEGTHVVRTLKILDFGIAKAQNASNTLTGGQLMFTPNYVSPEQIRGFDASPRSDMFAVGAVAYELLVQRKAFNIHPRNQFEIFEDLKRKIVEQPHAPMSTFRPDIDAELESIIDRALAKDPDARFRDLAEMRRQVASVRERLERRSSRDQDPIGSTERVDPPAVHGDVLLGLQALGADDPEQAVRHFERALAHGIGDVTPRALAEPLARARAAVRERQLVRARHAQEEAVAAFRDGRSADGVRLLQAFEPAELVADALKDFTDAAALIATAEQVVASAPADKRIEALEMLDAAGPPTLVEGALARLRASHAQRCADEAHEAAVVDAIASARARFDSGEAEEAIEALERFTPTDTSVLNALADLRQRRRTSLDQQRARAEADATARARDAIEKARALFCTGERDRAITALRSFPDANRVAGALEALQSAVVAIDSAHATVGTGSATERDTALERLGWFADRDLVDAALTSLRAQARERSKAETLEAAADKAIRESRETFWRGERDAAIAQLREFTPRTPAVDTALQELVDIVRSFQRQERQAAARAEAEARAAAEAKAREQVRHRDADVAAPERQEADAKPAEATRTAAEVVSLRPGHSEASALLADTRVDSRAATHRRTRTLAVWVGVPIGVLLVVAAVVSRLPLRPATSPAASRTSAATTTIPVPATTSSVEVLPGPPTATPVDVTLDAQPWARFVVRATDPNAKQPPVRGVTPARISLLPGQYVVDLENGGVTQPLRQRLLVARGPFQRAFVMPGFDADRAATALLADEQSGSDGGASRRVR